jgi:hypothetical protein
METAIQAVAALLVLAHMTLLVVVAEPEGLPSGQIWPLVHIHILVLQHMGIVGLLVHLPPTGHLLILRDKAYMGMEAAVLVVRVVLLLIYLMGIRWRLLPMAAGPLEFHQEMAEML